MPRSPQLDPTRRRALQLLGGSVLFTILGCAEEPGPEPLRIPLAALDGDTRIRVVHDERPIEIRREGDSVVARSLLCTHQGCEVKWDEGEGQYLCPCHDGAFDAAGEVLFGPPTRALERIPVRIEGAELVLE